MPAKLADPIGAGKGRGNDSMPSTPDARLIETWQVRKPAVRSSRGLVASHHHEASAIGAEVLAAGGNAVDAAVAAGLAIGVAEPWMSGPGGCGFMLCFDAGSGRCRAVDFGVVSPRRLDPGDYPVIGGGSDDDLFGWPLVAGDRNVHGPLSFAVPGLVAGLDRALACCGTIPWREAISPAIALARRGMKVDWYATLRIALDARMLLAYRSSRDHFLPQGVPPASPDPQRLLTLRSEAQLATLERLRDAGADDFYRGDIASAIARDLRELDATLDRDDLAAYRARLCDARSSRYRDAVVHATPGPNAGPSLLDALRRLSRLWRATASGPDPESYLAYARALLDAYRHRLATMGEGGGADCTTHLTVVDAKGNMAALTQTLLSVFGSRVVLPSIGFPMNNGIMWFDPRPGGPNAIAPGRRPLSNMCPAVVTSPAGTLALGASGGRQILPAVFQLVSFLIDHRMPLETAFHTPRIDVSGGDAVTADRRLAADIRAALARHGRTREWPAALSPTGFACPNAVWHDGRESHGCAHIMSPWASVASAG